jgi:kynurenine formamidase
MLMHIGTHIDTPLHSLEEGKTIDSYSYRQMRERLVLVS